MTAQPGEPAYRNRPRIDVARLWAGGAATAIVAALIAIVALMVFDIALDITPAPVGWVLGSDSWSLYTQYGFTGAVAAIAATGLLHLLLLGAPKPLVFFGWIVALGTIAAAVVPFGANAELDQQIATAVIAVCIGLVIGTALAAVAGRTVD